MDSLQCAWVAGVIEGEGSFVLADKFPRIRVTMTDLDVLERVLLWTGVGTLAGPHRRGQYKPYWVWTVSRGDDFLWLAEKIWPHMLGRRSERLEEMMAIAGERQARQIERRSAPGYRDRRKVVVRQSLDLSTGREK